MRPRRTLHLLALALALPVAGLAAEAPPREDTAPLSLHAFTFEHQPASEALALVRPLLSARGTVELQPGGNTLVVRDSLAALSRIAPLLEAFDHPARSLRLEMQIVRATTAPPVSPAVPPRVDPRLPDELVAKLRRLLRYERYDLLAHAVLESREGEAVAYRLGDEWRVNFRLGTLLGDRRVKLHGFQVAKAKGNPAARQLIHTNLNLWLGQTMILGLAPDEGSDHALMVVVTCREVETARKAER